MLCRSTRRVSRANTVSSNYTVGVAVTSIGLVELDVNRSENSSRRSVWISIALLFVLIIIPNTGTFGLELMLGRSFEVDFNPPLGGTEHV